MLVFSVIVLALALVTTHTYVILPKGLTATGRVVNGFNAVRNQFPYVVLLESHFAAAAIPEACGGSLIGNKWVLTAAHCVARYPIYLGVTHVDHAEASYTIWNIDIKIHPHYDSESYDNDIALIRIPHTGTCAEIKTARLPAIASSYPDYVPRFALFSGWGTTKSVQFSPLLQYVRLPVMPNDVCSQKVEGITSHKLCVDTTDYHRSPCFGDSGGPLVLQSTGELIGVMSTITSAGCDQGYPATFTRVTSYLEWIKSITGISWH